MPEPQPLMYVNGLLVPEGEAAVSPLDRGFTLADGLFETMVARGERVFRLDDHLERLRAGARLLDLPLPPAADLKGALARALRANGLADAVARLTVTRGVDIGRGLAIHGGAVPTVVVRVSPHAGLADPAAPGPRVVVSSIRRNDASPVSRAKTLAYTEGVVARREAQAAGADDALLLNTRGVVACGTASNLFVVVGGVAATPPVEDGALPGVARRTVAELARGMGIPFSERSLSPHEVEMAEEAFLTNVVGGVMPIAAIGGRGLGARSPGPVTLRLAEAYRRFLVRETGG